MTISMEDGTKVAVKLCDEHSEDTTVKKAKEAYLAKQSKLDELMAHAKALGFEISIQGSGLAVLNKQQTDIQEKQEKAKPVEVKAKKLEPSSPNSKIVSTKVLDSRSFDSVGVSAAGVPSGMPAYNTSSLQDKLPEDALEGTAEIIMTEGRTGQPLVIPQRRIDSTGTTIISIRKSENDRTLQDRFKNMADKSMRDEAPDLVHGGYKDTTRKCPVCRGACVVKMKEEMPCPKCGGSGLISVY